MTRVDKKFLKLGYSLDYSTKYGASYKKDMGKYCHVISILHKSYRDREDNYIIQSYQEDLNSDGFNNMDVMTKREAQLAVQKLNELKRIYRKEWRKQNGRT